MGWVKVKEEFVRLWGWGSVTGTKYNSTDLNV